MNYEVILGMRHPFHQFGPAWRWQLAGRYLENGKETIGTDDIAVQAVTLLRTYSLDSRPPKELSTKWVDVLRHALELQDQPSKRVAIEAYVLANLPTREIARRLRVNPYCIAEYERCLFAAREVLKYRGLIAQKIFDADDPLRSHVDRTVLRHAFFGGPAIAQHWLSHLPALGRNIEHDLETERGRERETLELHILADLSSQSDEWPSPHVIAELDRLCTRMDRLSTLGTRFVEALWPEPAKTPNWANDPPVIPHEPFRRCKPKKGSTRRKGAA